MVNRGQIKRLTYIIFVPFVEMVFSYFNALLCRHDHEGAEDAEMGIRFNVDSTYYSIRCWLLLTQLSL
jgi:hypothetical protein